MPLLYHQMSHSRLGLKQYVRWASTNVWCSHTYTKHLPPKREGANCYLVGIPHPHPLPSLPPSTTRVLIPRQSRDRTETACTVSTWQSARQSCANLFTRLTSTRGWRAPRHAIYLGRRSLARWSTWSGFVTTPGGMINRHPLRGFLSPTRPRANVSCSQ